MLAVAVLYPTLFAISFQGLSARGAYFALLILIVGVLMYALFEGRSITVTHGADGKVSVNGRRFDDGMVASALAVVLVVGLGVYCYYVLHSMFLTAILVGSMGGLAHEIAQSEGKCMLPNFDSKTRQFSLGSLFGLIAGGIAGLIFVAQGVPQAPQTGAASPHVLISESFLAGLGLKGFADAVNPSTSQTGTSTTKTAAQTSGTKSPS
jgi:hypothetical protein